MATQTVQVEQKQKVTIHDASGNIISIDATISEEHTFTSTATVHEIEGGDSISDHVVKKPIQITLTGVISGDPYPDEANITIDDSPVATVWDGARYVKIGVGALSGLVGSVTGGGVTGGVFSYGTSKIAGSLIQKAQQVQNDATRQQIAGKVGASGPSLIVKSAYDQLRSIYENKVVVAIQTGLSNYENMIMESLSLSRNKDTVRSLPFTASFKQIVFVSSETVTIPAMANKETSGRATPKQVQGVKQAVSPTAAVTAIGTTWARTITDSLGITNPVN